MAWVYLIAAILFEVGGTTCMKLSQGFTKLAPSAGMLVLYLCSLGLLNLSLKAIPVSVAYAVWSGVGTAAIAAIGVLVFREPMSVAKAAFLGLIIAGVVGLNLSGASH